MGGGSSCCLATWGDKMILARAGTALALVWCLRLLACLLLARPSAATPGSLCLWRLASPQLVFRLLGAMVLGPALHESSASAAKGCHRLSMAASVNTASLWAFLHPSHLGRGRPGIGSWAAAEATWPPHCLSCSRCVLDCLSGSGVRC